MSKSPPAISSIFADALACKSPREVDVLLTSACGSDAKLRRQVEHLLAAHHKAAGFLESETALPVDPSIAVGKAIGRRYKLLEAIGEGGMGTVWVAEQTEPVRRKVAIKLVKAGMDSKQVLVRFQAERQALALMDHPNIAKVLDGGVTSNGRPFFAMEYVKGVPITRYCDDAHLPLRERLKLFVSVCQAVQHAHQKGIIHRDLKPSNILVCQYDGMPVVKVIDFGLAKAINQPLTSQTLHTAHGIMIGTPLYMSPEQAEFNNLDVDTRTDIYSLGVVLYELLTGTTPLEKQQIQKAALDELLRLIKEVEPVRPSTRLSTSAKLPNIAAQRGIDPKQLGRLLKGDLDWIVMKSLEKDRSRRYETANGMARDIERFLADEQVEACPPTARYRLRKLMKRYRGPLAGASAVAAALVLGIVATTLAMFEARRQAGRAEVAVHEEAKARQQAERAEQRATEQLEVAVAEKLRADGEAARAIAANNFMRNLLGPPGSSGPGDGTSILDRRVSDVITAAAAALDGLDDQPQLELDGRLTLASTYAAIRSLGQAKIQYKRAAELSKILNGDDSDETLQIEIDYLFASQHAPSSDDIELGRRIAALLTRRHSADHPLTCDANNSLAVTLQQQGKLDEAIEVYSTIVDSIRRQPDVFHPKGKARYVSNMASALSQQGKEAEADQLVIEAAAICDGEPHTDPSRCLKYYLELGKVHAKHRRFEQALTAWKSAFDRSAALGLTDERGLLLSELIATSAQLGKFDLAAECIGILRKTFEHPELVELDGVLEVELTRSLVDILLADALIRSGKDREGRQLLQQADMALRDRAANDPDNAQWYPQQRQAIELRRRGTYDSQGWPSPAIGVAAETMLSYTVNRHVTGLDSPALDWNGLAIDLYRWEGPEVEVTASAFHGSLAELSHHEPTTGLYLLAFDLPRPGTFSAKEMVWVLQCDWEFAFYDADTLQLDRNSPWDTLERAVPLEQRRGAVAHWYRTSELDHFAGYSPATNVLAAGRTRLSLPSGSYQLGINHDGEGHLWVDGEKYDPQNHIEFGDRPREIKFIWKGTDFCYPWIEPRCPAEARLKRRVIPTIQWANCEVERAKAELDKDPNNAALIVDFARGLWRAGRFDEALHRMAEVEDRLSSDHYAMYQYATFLAYMREHERYRKLCAEMIDRYPEESHSAEVGERTAKCCLLFPAEVSKIDPHVLTARVDRAVNQRPSGNTPWYQLVKALHLYRLGDEHAAEAVEWIDRSIAAFPNDWSPSICYYLRAMALKKSGQHAEAAEAFQHAERFYAEHAHVVGRDDLEGACEIWFTDEIIAREARDLFNATARSSPPRP